MDRAAKRFGKSEGDAAAKAKSTASEEDTPKAKPGMGDKEVAEKPNAVGAEAQGRHMEEMTAMHKRHLKAMTDMHSMHADEMKQMHARHAQEMGGGKEGPALPSAKQAGKGWKTKDKGEPKGD